MLALDAALPPHLFKQEITALNCAKNLLESVWTIRRKSSWLLQGFQRKVFEWYNYMKEREKTQAALKAFFCSTAVDYFLLFRSDKTRPLEFVQCHSTLLDFRPRYYWLISLLAASEDCQRVIGSLVYCLVTYCFIGSDHFCQSSYATQRNSWDPVKRWHRFVHWLYKMTTEQQVERLNDFLRDIML